jgi:hypothetical protein
MKTALKVFGIITVSLGGLMFIGCLSDLETYGGGAFLLSAYILAQGIISILGAKK